MRHTLQTASFFTHLALIQPLSIGICARPKGAILHSPYASASHRAYDTILGSCLSSDIRLGPWAIFAVSMVFRWEVDLQGEIRNRPLSRLAVGLMHIFSHPLGEGGCEASAPVH